MTHTIRLFSEECRSDWEIASIRRYSKMVICGLLGTVLIAFSMAASASQADWGKFKQRFVAPEGRVIDAAQDNISHSEGQGYGMLLAVYFDDKASFDRIWQWTKKNLQVRDDHLLAWRWDPRGGVTDKNNASDGDLLVAWSLLRAFNKWHDPQYRLASQGIALDIRTKMLKQSPQGLVMLPGSQGYDHPEGITVNLSYWVFPALDEIGQVDPSPQWAELAKTGMTILGYARFGRWGLPPDWLVLTKIVAPSPRFPTRFGYNAVRIPLYLLWSRRESPALLKPYQDFWSYFQGAKFLPSWTNLEENSVDTYDTSAGIHKLAQWVIGYPRLPDSRKYPLDENQGYYSSVLLLLSDMAIKERGSK
ncbi:MAG: glycosyl hydrolase family 8 [Burkholderiales bacterium]